MTAALLLMPLLALAVIVIFWQEQQASLEHATRLCKRLCEEHGVQWLDQTVSLEGMRLCLANGLHWRRRYRFDFSRRGSERWHGRISLLGRRLEWVDMPDETGRRVLQQEGETIT
jgi:hypothetical protein